MIHVKPLIIRTAALAVFASSLAFAAPLYAAARNTQSDQDMQTQDQSSGKMHANGRMEVENRIKTLHDKLKITDDQEADWEKVAQAMRDNEAKIHDLIQTRHQNPDNMTAVDDLQSYQEIAQAHADGLQNLTAAFQTLYNEMSDDQKHNADEVFGRFEGHRGNTSMKKKHQ